ncbi:putative ATP-dependent RNA helicase DHX37 isoform X1 [Temnothorax americanus]|uniref:putative ATP-dependent RNA helicase DHX37 isoform X1 n=1 Tax=Temnothorax americanus TaxID=1964332 RepID=UPI004067F984
MGTTIDGYRASVDGVKWFAYFFLKGQVYLKLKRFVPSLLTTPGSITKSWAKLIPRTQAIIQTLQSQGVVSKYKQLEIWGLDEKCISAVMLAAMLILVKICYTTDSIQVVLYKISIQ